jgi:hypothetical protein
VTQVKQLFCRVPAASFTDSHEQRFAAFATRTWPRLKEADASGVLVFASSYLEFVRLRAFFKQQHASLAVNSEYTDSSSVMRARMRFRKGERALLLYTERAHFYFRPKLRCAFGFDRVGMFGALESVRLRVFFKQRCPLLAANSEYTDSSSLMRARLRFSMGDRALLLCAERARFYSRASLQCSLQRLVKSSLVGPYAGDCVELSFISKRVVCASLSPLLAS